jgi:hypothetical protein
MRFSNRRRLAVIEHALSVLSECCATFIPGLEHMASGVFPDHDSMCVSHDGHRVKRYASVRAVGKIVGGPDSIHPALKSAL